MCLAAQSVISQYRPHPERTELLGRAPISLKDFLAKTLPRTAK
jgi:hypothetical protein